MELVSGTIFEYYHICTRKTWYCANGISMESENENVQLGKLIDENSYSREKKHILINDCASIDFFKDSRVFEIKKSRSELDAAVSQVKYYLYVLKRNGVDTDGELRVPKENYSERIVLSHEDIKQIETELADIHALLSQKTAPAAEKTKICGKCAYYELCFC